MTATAQPDRIARVMDDLVADARSSRDGLFNTLDAVQRQSKGAADALVSRIETFCVDHPRGSRPVDDEVDAGAVRRDPRFDPEDEWDVPGPSALESGAAASNAPRGVDDTDDNADDGYAQTWLR